MFLLLRKFRKALLKPGSSGRYLSYAFGEIALVVIGILIALQINNWNEAKKTDRLKLRLLTELKTTAEEDFQRNQHMINQNRTSVQSIDYVIRHIENELPFTDSLSFHFAHAHNRWVCLISSHAYDNLKEFGIDFLQDETRHIMVSLYEGNLEYLRMLDDRNTQFYYNVVVPLTTKLFDISYPQGRFESQMTPYSYRDLQQNRHYLTVLKSMRAYREQYLAWQENVMISACKSLSNRLEEEIQKMGR